MLFDVPFNRTSFQTFIYLIDCIGTQSAVKSTNEQTFVRHAKCLEDFTCDCAKTVPQKWSMESKSFCRERVVNTRPDG